MKKYVSYLRVSTQKQGRSGLGLEAQRKICNDFVERDGGEIVAEYIDVESGTHRARKGLANAVAYCKTNGTPLVIAKLDRLARDVEFCFKVVNTGIEIHFCDMPQVNTLLLGVFASVAQYERELTSDRTKKALAAKKARGEATGGASEAWQVSYKTKSKQQKEYEQMKRGMTKNARYIESKDVRVFLKILKTLFPDACADEDPTNWDWSVPNTKAAVRPQMIALMRDYREMDDSHTLFRRWDLSEDNRALQMRLAANIQNIRTAFKTRRNNDEQYN